MNSFFKKIAIFFIGAILPAALIISFSTLILGNCDPKFGCMGSLVLLFKFSVLPIAVISSISVFGVMISLSRLGKLMPINNLLLFGTGSLISILNIWSFKLAETNGILITILAVIVLSCTAFFMLNRRNITKP